MTADEVAQFYRELRPAVTALGNADNTEAGVTAEPSGNSDPYDLVCSSIAAATLYPDSLCGGEFPGVTPTVDGNFVAYAMAITIGGVVVPHPECVGVLQMPAAEPPRCPADSTSGTVRALRPGPPTGPGPGPRRCTGRSVRHCREAERGTREVQDHLVAGGGDPALLSR